MQKDTQNNFEITFVPSGRGQPRCPPDPRFPNGILIDFAGKKIGCMTALERAPECGIYVVKCRKCGTNAGIMVASRPDDPHTVIMPCKSQGE